MGIPVFDRPANVGPDADRHRPRRGRIPDRLTGMAARPGWAAATGVARDAKDPGYLSASGGPWTLSGEGGGTTRRCDRLHAVVQIGVRDVRLVVRGGGWRGRPSAAEQSLPKPQTETG